MPLVESLDGINEREIIAEYTLDPDLLHCVPGLLWIVKGWDNQRLRETWRSNVNRIGSGVFGSSDPNDLLGRRGGVYYVPNPDTSNEIKISDRESWESRHAIINHALLNPRDVVMHDGILKIVSHGAITELDITKSDLGWLHQQFVNPELFSTPHSIERFPSGGYVVTNSGNDCVTFLDEANNVVGRWNAVEEGFNLTIGRHTNRVLSYKNIYRTSHPPIFPAGYVYVEYDKPHLHDFPTAHQVTHVNSAIPFRADEDKVMISLFSTKKIDSFGNRNSIGGSDGKVLLIDRHDKHASNVVIFDGLFNPHSVTWFGKNKYGFVESSAGIVKIFSVDKVDNTPHSIKVIDFNGLPDYVEEKPWLQTMTVDNDIIYLVNTQRSAIEIIDINNRRRAEIKIVNPDIVLHSVKPVINPIFLNYFGKGCS